ncbi:hypothetical protein CEXT_776371 [Caerostris extrusa]|uniref:Uncharacterized protein n=1 Tax=Caerostris extrusa TaxID=172846 RepID=A0AAV4NG80_CAEEX|nr:hypothetical protein CEXT_776371 [Caerostris extrusa]
MGTFPSSEAEHRELRFQISEPSVAPVGFKAAKQPPYPAQRRQPQEPDLADGESPSPTIPSNMWQMTSFR